jgi:hypothetical protein
MYDELEHVILPMFYERPTAYPQVMRSAIAINGSFFNMQWMVSQYLANAYFLEEVPSRQAGFVRQTHHCRQGHISTHLVSFRSGFARDLS